MKFDLTILFICVGLFVFFCCVAVLAENRKIRIRRRARKIFGRIRYVPEAASVEDKTCFNCRNTRWGMDKKAVLASESEPLLEENENILTFTAAVLGKPCRLVYGFDNGALVSLRYNFGVKYTCPNAYVDMFNVLMKRLTRRYGVPSARDVFWAETISDSAQFDGAAVAEGRATYSARWKTPYTLVLATLGEQDGTPQIVVECFSLAHLKRREGLFRP